MTNAELMRLVDAHGDMILAAERYIWSHPETGYREWNTSAYLAGEFEKLGYSPRLAGDIPGFTAELDTGRPGPRVLVMGEMDSLICEGHPDAAKGTYAVHACGHNAQCAALLGLAASLKAEGATAGMCGKILLCAVPAEELIETGYRETLRASGVIKYFGGKPEFLRRGYFDGVDMAILFHTTGGKHAFTTTRGSNGCVVKNIAYEGLAAHAGGAPSNGINALYAATLGMQAINSLRETFRDEDHVRVHPIITKGGAAVNAIPASVTLESYVRGASIDVIRGVNRRVNRALAASALALGANVALSDRPGYMPLTNDKCLMALAERAMGEVVPSDMIDSTDGWSTGCTDMGDMSVVMPTIHPYACGAEGAGHGADYRIADPVRACLNSAKAQLVLLNMLLSDGAIEAKRVHDGRETRFKRRDEYFALMDSFIADIRAVDYEDEGRAVVTF